MPEKDKGFSFRSLFLRDAGTDAPKKQIQDEKPVNVRMPQVILQLVNNLSVVEVFPTFSHSL